MPGAEGKRELIHSSVLETRRFWGTTFVVNQDFPRLTRGKMLETFFIFIRIANFIGMSGFTKHISNSLNSLVTSDFTTS